MACSPLLFLVCQHSSFPAFCSLNPSSITWNLGKILLNKTGVINDPLGQIHSPDSNDRYFHLKIVLFCEILKFVNGRTDCMCENNDHYWIIISWPSGSISMWYKYSIQVYHEKHIANAKYKNFVTFVYTKCIYVLLKVVLQDKWQNIFEECISIHNTYLVYC